jgi:N-acetylglucosaminyldiphosphoundecaprenol N-acetyl-beta-D-mannosaminyltransferase
MVSSSPVVGRLREVRFAGLRFTPLTVDEAVRALATRSPGAKFDVFITPNAEHAFLKRGNPEFVACSDEAFVSTNDSRVLRRAAYLAGIELEFAPGAYVVADLFKSVIGPDTPITIIGCEPDIVARLTAHYGLTKVNHHNPPMGMIRNPQAVQDAIDYIAAQPAPFVFVAMGPPQSEQFCQRVIEDGRATGVGLCIGSSLSVLTRTSNPAPDWMEQSGLVWLYRLATEPKRLWKRYLVRGVYSLGLSARDIVIIRLGLRRPADA